MKITTNFCGGNGKVLSVDTENKIVRFAQELRDTEGGWFYWAFCVEGAAGETVTFDMAPQSYIGYFGAAVSHDLVRWDWTYTANSARTAFTYTFGADETRVYFAHDMLYHPSQFALFCELHGLIPKTLCEDRNGTPIPYVTVGSGDKIVLLTARHHCCEATGDYIMEGILDEFTRNPSEEYTLIAIPFIDADGVVRGDQGKNRKPHDHNRDYIEGIYPGVRAVRSIMGQGHVEAVFDLHSPWHLGGRNDKVFVVRNYPAKMEEYRRFGKCFMAEITESAMQYDTKNDIDPGVEWNELKTQALTCGTYCGTFPGVDLSFSLETTYFGEEGNVVSQEKLVETGRCFWRGYLSYRREN